MKKINEFFLGKNSTTADKFWFWGFLSFMGFAWLFLILAKAVF